MSTSLKLNTIQPAKGAKQVAKRVGRGTGSGLGKTCGRGSKGQKSRAGSYRRVGFEGGQMPVQRRLPKFGFRSPQASLTAQVQLHELANITQNPIDHAALIAAGVVPKRSKKAKVILSGRLDRAVVLQGIAATRGARRAIESVGGKVEE